VLLPAAGLLEIDFDYWISKSALPPPEDTPLQQQQQHIIVVFWQAFDINAH